MYVIKYADGIYAGTYSDMDGNYLYSSNYSNMCKPKIFKTIKGAEKHLMNLKNEVVYGNSAGVYNFQIVEWSEDELIKHLKYIGMNEVDSFLIGISFRARKDSIDVASVDVISKDKKLEKYWKRVFRPLRNQEIEITSIIVSNNICTISYLMPYCTSTEEYIFQADYDNSDVIDGFCNAVETRANEIITMIRECCNIREVIKGDS